MKYLVLKPRGTAKIGTPKLYEEFEASKVIGVEAFITQHTGKEPVKRIIGDYTFWISNPNTVVFTEAEEAIIPDTITDLTPNLLVNEFEFAYGDVVVTSNFKVSPDKQYEGLTDLDIGYILNAFTLCDSMVVDSSGQQVAVDKINDNFLIPNGLENQPVVNLVPDLSFENSIDDSEIK